jgi:Domain of unknown function (DUF4402)
LVVAQLRSKKIETRSKNCKGVIYQIATWLSYGLLWCRKRGGLFVKLSSLLCVFIAILSVFGVEARAQAISLETPISFGEMVVGGTGSITIPSSNDTRSASGAIAMVGSEPVNRGSITITFTPGAQVVITIPASIVMTGANAPTITPTIEGGTVQTIPPGGVLVVYFGGTMSFSTSGASGPAECLIPVNVDPL